MTRNLIISSQVQKILSSVEFSVRLLTHIANSLILTS